MEAEAYFEGLNHKQRMDYVVQMENSLIARTGKFEMVRNALLVE